MMHVVVFGDRAGADDRAGRTLRWSRHLGLDVDDATSTGSVELAEALDRTAGPVWLLRAGAWQSRPGAIRFPPPSATGLPLIALGRVHRPGDSHGQAADDAEVWAQLHEATGGDFSRDAADAPLAPPPLASVYVEDVVRRAMAERLRGGATLHDALCGEIRLSQRRVVHCGELDVRDDAALRIVQVVTSLQRGGAERVSLDLTRELPAQGVRCRIVALGRPGRAPFPEPPGCECLADCGGDREARASALLANALEFGADLIHAHLIDAADARRFARFSIPIIMTIHNTRRGWPRGLEELRPGDAALLVACARAVEVELTGLNGQIPRRTAWNGIDFGSLQPTRERTTAAVDLRREWNAGPRDLILLVVANPRAQKRLHLLPEILVATQHELRRQRIQRRPLLIIVGEAGAGSEDAAEALGKLHAEIDRCCVSDQVRLVGPVTDMAPVLAAADVLLSASAHEGLSLAHLEAIAAGKPVVATAAGGTAELADGNPAVTLLPIDAEATEFAAALARIARRAPPSGHEIAAERFTLPTMAGRYRRLYHRAIATARRKPPAGLLLVCNNFSTGGAQSSAKRLLLGLQQQGIRVRAAAIQEQTAFPTRGRRELAAAGVPVLALDHAPLRDPLESIERLLRAIDRDPPAAIVFWNALAEHKILLADALWDIPIFDVSPGEMYFTSLERYFDRPRRDIPYRAPRDYGERLAGIAVKFAGEAARAAELLGSPVHLIPNGVPVEARPSQNGYCHEANGRTRARIASCESARPLV